jgi:hypothetical protein
MNMNRISDSHIEHAWQEVTEATASKEKLTELMAHFGEAQPAVVEFISEASSQWESDAADLVFHASLVIWLSFLEAQVKFSQVQSEQLVEQFQKNLDWLEAQQGDAVLLQKKLVDFSRFSEPELMRYVVELIFEAHEDGLEVEPEEQQQLLLVLKTLIDSMLDSLTDSSAAGP